MMTTRFIPGQRVRVNSRVTDRFGATTRVEQMMVGREGTVREHDRLFSFSDKNPAPICTFNKVIVDLDDDGSGLTRTSCEPEWLDLIDVLKIVTKTPNG